MSQIRTMTTEANEEYQEIAEDLIKAASVRSLPGELCKWVGALIAVFGSIVAFSITYETADRRGLLAIAAFLGGGLPLSAIGSIATSSKRSARTSLIQAQLSKISLIDHPVSMDN